MKCLMAVDASQVDAELIDAAKQMLEDNPEGQMVAVYVSQSSEAAPCQSSVEAKEVVLERVSANKVEFEMELVEQFRSFGSRFRFEHVSGDPLQIIREMAETEDADLLLVGKPHHMDRTHLHAGNLVYDLIYKSPCSVFVV